MSKENFEKQIRKRMEQLDEINKHGIFKELKGTVTDFNYDTKSLTMTFEATKFHENAFGIMFGGSLAGMFDIAFGTLTAGLGDYSVAPTVQLSTTFLKGIPTGATVRTEVEAVSTGKTINILFLYFSVLNFLNGRGVINVPLALPTSSSPT